jgi:hypothetical protein
VVTGDSPVGSGCDANATEEPPITDEMTNLRTLVEKTPDADLLREMIGLAAKKARPGAAYGEKNPERLAQRNGDRDRIWETRVGAVGLRIPKLRKGSYFRASAAWPRRRSPPWWLMFRASPPARSTTSCRRWA